MIQFLESIRLVDGVLQQLDLHQQRVNGTLATHYKTNILLSSIEIPAAYREGIYKCRIVYDEKIQEVAFQPYTLKPRKCVKFVYANDIDYQYKYADRTLLNKLWHKANTDDIVIVKNGLLSDSAYANIILENDKGLFTPARPLLKGTMRQSLLNKNAIQAKDISIEQLPNYQYLHFINAMQPLGCQSPIKVKDILK
ncbi:MAG: aminotransferase class IV [Prevotella bivia]|nr:aminotransferase class IV [Prevotella bivia]